MGTGIQRSLVEAQAGYCPVHGCGELDPDFDGAGIPGIGDVWRIAGAEQALRRGGGGGGGGDRID